ncbi:hypothetical protein [Leptospira congkakensis]|nr:hypothetical protein [Leptospira congkakensis]
MPISKKLTQTHENKIEKILQKMRENPDVIHWIELTIIQFEKEVKKKNHN